MKSAFGMSLLGAMALSCHGTSSQPGHSADEPAASTQIAGVVAQRGATDGGIGGLDEGIPRLAIVLEDPRLATARACDELRDYACAARELDAARAIATLEPASACAWAYVSGRLHLAASEISEAASAFETLLSSATPEGCGILSSYAALRDAQALVRLGRNEEALARARAVGEENASHDEVRMTLADAYAGKGDRASAIPIWRGLLGAAPNGLRWADMSVLLATSLLEGGDGPPSGHAREALELATKVLVESPWVQDSLDVIGLRTRAASLLGQRFAPPLTLDERAKQAQAWLDFSKPKRATEVAEAILAAIPAGETLRSEAACKAAMVRAQAIPRGKPEETAEAWRVAIARCEGAEGLVTALYQGAKASASAHHAVEASEHFDRVEKLFPNHRFADDARFRSALAAYEQGDEARYLALMSSIPDVYPDGDMKSEALFRVALTKLAKRDLEGARTALDRVLALGMAVPATLEAGAPALRVDDRAILRAAYFRARVAQLAGESEDAKARYMAIVRNQPLTYYMLQAYGRLRAMSEPEARSAIQLAMARETAGPFLTRPHSELASPVFYRFLQLLSVGEIEGARREARAAGLTAEGVDPEVLWAIAWLYDAAGAPEVGHAFSRARLLDYRAHWPVGRWRFAWQTAYPNPWDATVTRESESAGIPAPLTWAVMREESAFDPDAHSSASAIGLMQLLLSTVRQMTRGTALVVDESALRRPEVSIAMGARFLSSLRSSFPSNPALAIAAYNAGSTAIRRWLSERRDDDFDVFIERIPFEETRGYLKRVLASQAAYAFLYAPRAFDELLALPLRATGQDLAAGPVAAP